MLCLQIGGDCSCPRGSAQCREKVAVSAPVSGRGSRRAGALAVPVSPHFAARGGKGRFPRRRVHLLPSQNSSAALLELGPGH